MTVDVVNSDLVLGFGLKSGLVTRTTLQSAYKENVILDKITLGALY